MTLAPSWGRNAAQRLAALPDRAFLASIAAACVVATLWLGRHLTFYLDECDFLARNLANPIDWLRPHNEHWVTVAFPIYKVVSLLAGTESYAPYLLLLVLTQIFMAVGVYWLVLPRSRWFAIFAPDHLPVRASPVIRGSYVPLGTQTWTISPGAISISISTR